MRIRCNYCRWWDEKDRLWRYHMAEKTCWQAPLGEDPRLRQFVCKNCGTETYVLFTEGRIEKEWESGC